MTPPKTVRSKNKFSKVDEYKVNIQNQLHFFFYNRNELSEREIKKTITCKVASKKPGII